MSDKNTGGPAFPSHGSMGEVVQSGMTLRDYFAAKAMPAIYQDMWEDVRAGRFGNVPEDWKIGVAMDAYAMADAMLRARENT